MATTFITETRATLDDFPADDVGELEALVSGVTQTSQSTLLLKKRKEMREVDDALEFMKEEYATRMQACEERQRDFERKQNEMKDQVARFEKFIQENDAKLKRAKQKAAAEQKACKQCEGKIAELTTQAGSLSQSKAEKIAEVERLLKFRTYLERTVEASEEQYPESDDILSRHKTLEEANEDLQERVNSGSVEMDRARADLADLQRESTTKVLVMNSRVDAANKELEQRRGELQDLSEKIELAANHSNSVSTRLGQVELSIRNIYGRCVLSMEERGKSAAQIKERQPAPDATYAALMELKQEVLRENLKLVSEAAGEEADSRKAAGGEAEHAGYLFMCSQHTIAECLERGLMGAEECDWPEVRRVGPNTLLFLHDESGCTACFAPRRLPVLDWSLRHGPPMAAAAASCAGRRKCWSAASCRLRRRFSWGRASR